MAETAAVKRIINVGVLAHVDAGKTTLTERLLLCAGAIASAGGVDSGTAHTDNMDVERERGISVRSACVELSWRGVGVNIIDTPGHADFSADAERAVGVLDAAVLVVSAAEGVQARTELLWDTLRRAGLPVLIFLNKCDRVGADPRSAVAELREALSQDIVPLTVWNGAGAKNVEAGELAEAVAERDEAALETLLEHGSLEAAMLEDTARRLTAGRELFPLFCGAALRGEGVAALLDAIVRLLPSGKGAESAPFSALVYRVEHDARLGRLAHVRVFAGRAAIRDSVDCPRLGQSRKITRIRGASVLDTSDRAEVRCGQIAALCGMADVRVGDVLGDAGAVPPQLPVTPPLLSVRVRPERAEDEPALLAVLEQLTAEDPTLDVEWERELRQMLVHVTGLIQIEVLGELILRRSGIAHSFGKPSVIYKETPATANYGFAAYTMPKPCWAVVNLYIEPLPRGSGLVYESVVNDNQILPRYQNHVGLSLADCVRQGIRGWEVTDLRVTLIDGNHHPMHTHPMDFFVATPMAFMDGLTRCGTSLLEPVMRFEVRAPEAHGAAIIGQVLHMRGELGNTSISGGVITVSGCVPLAEALEFPVWVASATGGRGTLSMRFDRWEVCPPGVGESTPYRGVDPLDTARYILAARGALSTGR